MISHTAEYAIRAAVHLAENDEAAPLNVGELASALGAPRNYLSKILGSLAREGILTSARGPAGGFRLAVSSDRLRLSRIVGLFDPLPGRRCLLGRPRCSEKNPCSAHHLWKGVAQQMDDFFRHTTVAQLLEGGQPGRTGVAVERQKTKSKVAGETRPVAGRSTRR